MLCADVERVAYFFLDGSLGTKKRSDLSSHIGICPDCEARIVIHRRMRSLVKERLAPVSAPEHFRVRLVQSIRAVAAG